VTTAKRPLAGTGCRHEIINSEKAKQDYFYAQDWTGRVALKALSKLTVRRRCVCAGVAGTW
jgi:hypothetical protein